jgi:DNA-binding NarL/FixJ family response regulator
VNLIHILLAEQHHLLHPSIEAIIAAADDLTLLAAVTTRQALLHQIERQDAALDLLLFSPNIDSMSLAETLSQIRLRRPAVKLLAMLSSPEEDCVHQLINQGVAGLLLKTDPVERLLEAIYAVSTGHAWFSLSLLPMLVQSQSLSPESTLTDREVEVLGLVVADKTNSEIAQALDIGERTVRCHLQNIYGKLGARSRVGAAVQAVRQNLIP